MSASEKGSKIDLLDRPENIKEKIMDAYCPQGEKENNGILEHLKMLIMPVLKSDGRKFIIERPEKWGGDLVYENYEKVENDYLSGDLHPQDLKKSVAKELIEILEPIRDRFEGKEALIERAYPENE